MTEAEWLTAKEPTPILLFLQDKVSERKMRLFAVACCRRQWPQMTDGRSRTAVETAEAFADGKASQSKLSRARSAVRAGIEMNDQGYMTTPLMFAASFCADNRMGVRPALSCILAGLRMDWPDDVFIDPNILERAVQSQVARSIFGNPFRPVVVEPTWLTETVVALAEGIYQERAFDRMPILADALEEAGCDNVDVLNHCRGDGPHVRGGWVVDLLTGRK